MTDQVAARSIINQRIEQVSVEKVSEHPRNARVGETGIIAESITANGFYGVIIVQRSTGYILAGNHRYRAAVAQGLTKIPVCWVDVDDDHAMRIMLADNRTADVATYDDASLLQLLEEVGQVNPNLIGTGFDLEALAALRFAANPEFPETEPPAGLDQKHPVTCPDCGAEFIPS